MIVRWRSVPGIPGVRHVVPVLSGMLVSMTAAASSLQKAIPFKQEVAAGGDGWSRLGAAMLVCIAVLALVLYLLRRHLKLSRLPGGGLRASLFSPSSASQALPRLQVLETRRLGPRMHLHVVQFGGREHLIGSSDQGLVTLASAPLPELAEGGEPAGPEDRNSSEPGGGQ